MPTFNDYAKAFKNPGFMLTSLMRIEYRVKQRVANKNPYYQLYDRYCLRLLLLIDMEEQFTGRTLHTKHFPKAVDKKMGWINHWVKLEQLGFIRKGEHFTRERKVYEITPEGRSLITYVQNLINRDLDKMLRLLDKNKIKL